jgi:hypothetical protein
VGDIEWERADGLCSVDYDGCADVSSTFGESCDIE